MVQERLFVLCGEFSVLCADFNPKEKQSVIIVGRQVVQGTIKHWRSDHTQTVLALEVLNLTTFRQINIVPWCETVR
jgi:hypothetical protein